MLDRIVGYKISPLLWDKVRRGLSAGRVQTVALRLIVEREQEIRAFVPQEYWTIHAMMDAGEPPIFEAKLSKYRGEDIEVNNQEAADAVVAAVSEGQVASGERCAEGKTKKRAAAVYDIETATGCVQPATIYGEENDGAGAAVV